MPAAPTIPSSVERAYELLLWLDAHVVQLPAHTRAALGAHALQASVSLLDALLVAAYAPREGVERSDALRLAAHRLALLRFLLRALRDRCHLSVEQHAHAASLVDALGRQVGAWRRAT